MTGRFALTGGVAAVAASTICMAAVSSQPVTDRNNSAKQDAHLMHLEGDDFDRSTLAPGPDVTLGGIQDIVNHGAVGGIYAYSIGSQTCNIGDADLLWLNNGTPGFGTNAYRLHNGQFMQIGLSFVKHACCVANSSAPSLCAGMSCQSGLSGHLRVGCLDVYGASWNSAQGRLGPRSGINAYTGSFAPLPGGTGNAIFRRTQVNLADMSTTTYPGALYFIEGVYVATQDAQSGNWFNNASYRRVTVNASFSMALTGPTYATVPAIYAWQDHGGGVNNPDPNVKIIVVDVPAEGRFFVGTRYQDNGDGTWRYDYNVYNLSSDRSGGSFTVPIGDGVNVTNVGFNAPFYHSGEPAPFNTPWTQTVSSNAVTWSHMNEGANSNAIRWGTMYSFWFTADQPPTMVMQNSTLGLFKSGSPASVSAAVFAPDAAPAPACPADLNGDGDVDVLDMLELFAAWGSCSGCAADLNGDGAVDVLDMLELFAAWGPCP